MRWDVVRKTIFITDYAWPSLDLEREQLEGAGYRVVHGTGPALPGAEIEAIAAREKPQAIMTCWAQVSPATVAHCRDLTIVARYGVGLDNIALEAAWACGARVTHVPDYCTEEVSDHAIALLMGWSRGIVLWDRQVKQGLWNPALARVHRTARLTVGIAGYGRVGRMIVRKLRGFGCRLLAFGRTRPAGSDAEGIEWVSWADLLTQSDAVIALLPLSPQTAGVFGHDAFARMRHGSLLINVSRGGLVDNDALLTALDAGILDCAALDVVDGEPNPPAQVIGHPRVIATPHIAFSSPHAIEELRRRTIDEVLRALRGEPARVLVKPSIPCPASAGSS